MASSDRLLWARQNGDGSEQAEMQDQQAASASSVVTTLVPVLVYAVVFFLLFCLFRKWFPRNYRPRAMLGALRPSERTPDLPNGFFNWIPAFYQIPDTYVLQHHSLDGYLFLRFLKISVVTCLVGCVITFPVLFPINITGGGVKVEFEILTMANVTNNYFKMFAHAGCAMIFFGFVIYMITRETIFFINLRQAYLMSPYYTSRLSSKVVMYTSVPDDYMNESKLRDMLGSSVRRVWLATDTKELEELVGERDKAHMKLEAAETKLIKTAYGNKLKADKKAAKSGERSNSEEAAMADTESGLVSARYLQPKERPVHRLKPLIGKKVDTIDWSRGELQKLIPKVAQLQAAQKKRDAKLLGTAFVEFASVHDAQAAYQSLTHHHILHMQPRFTGMTPTEIIWSNLNIKWWERVIRQILVISFVVALVVFWAIPVAFVGSISKVDKLIELIPALSFINNLPKQLLGLITGLLPVILLAVLMALLPIILRLAAKISGCPTRSAVELAVQNYYFAFQVIQVFLVATLGASAAAVVQSVKDDPASAPSLLANNIPTASTFYLSYFILQGLSVVANVLLGVVGLIVFKLLGKLLDNTPRKMYKRWISLSGLGWGTLFPIYTNLFVIAICYATIAPLVLLFAAIGLYFFYCAYRYNMLYVYNMDVDTKGAVYPRALQQVFVGLYIAEVCLIGLFAMASGGPSQAPANGESGPEVNVYARGALGPLILMIITLVFTALYHISLNSAISPHLEALPKSIAAEEERLLIADGHYGDAAAKEAAQESAQETFDAQGNPALATPAPHKRPNMLTKFLRPDIYTDYATLRRIVPQAEPVVYSREVEENAYYNPAITSELDIIWIPRDPLGVSREAVRDTGKILPITDEGAHLDEKNNIVWGGQYDEEQPPIYQEKVYY